ncbi:MAG: hypothetical protein JO270_07165 [Acidobacteriaceae bacterium]|nr:hypothetical protein [Acidobacteriaceae bacterium]MBV8569132.1 hypothetical protein [Acidobacteriaceae bacterium]
MMNITRGGGLPDMYVGTFSQALMDEANKEGWFVVSMKHDWNRIFGFETQKDRQMCFG